MKASKIYFIAGNNVFVITKGYTNNEKIAPAKTVVIQTYTYSLEQYNKVRIALLTGKKFTMAEFFELDKSNCLDCPFSGNMHKSGLGAISEETGKKIPCYTHKYQQYAGMLSSLRSIVKKQKGNDLPVYDSSIYTKIVSMCAGVYVRFGTYGEPSLLPYALVSSMAKNASSFTGYTHQYKKDFASLYANYFMASCHTQKDANEAKDLGFRSFVAKDKNDLVSGVVCPASKEKNYVSNCSKCGLCSGIAGKGSKDVVINLH